MQRTTKGKGNSNGKNKKRVFEKAEKPQQKRNITDYGGREGRGRREKERVMDNK